MSTAGTGGAGLVIVGASLAGLRAAEGARRQGYTGSIVMIGEEPHTPYDRPPLSKSHPAEPEPDIEFRPRHELTEELGIDLRLGAPATGLDPSSRTIQVGDEEVPFSSAVLATGARARQLKFAQQLDGVHTLRTLDDARAVRAALGAARHLVVIGAGFIGSELASTAAAAGVKVTVVELAPIPLSRVIGDSLGAAISALHTRNGTTLLCGVSVDELNGEQAVSGVTLSDGTRLDADLVIVGAGAVPATDWLEQSGIELGNGIVCDAGLQTSVPRVFAAGDVARWPNAQFARTMRLEHWTNAAEQGIHAGRAAVDPDFRQPFTTVPYFWSDLYGSRVQGMGITAGNMHVLEGNLDDEQFLAGFREGDSIIGVLSLNMPHRIMKYRRFLGCSDQWQQAAEFAGAAASRVART